MTENFANPASLVRDEAGFYHVPSPIFPRQPPMGSKPNASTQSKVLRIFMCVSFLSLSMERVRRREIL